MNKRRLVLRPKTPQQTLLDNDFRHPGNDPVAQAPRAWVSVRRMGRFSAKPAPAAGFFGLRQCLVKACVQASKDAAAQSIVVAHTHSVVGLAVQLVSCSADRHEIDF